MRSRNTCHNNHNNNTNKRRRKRWWWSVVGSRSILANGHLIFLFIFGFVAGFYLTLTDFMCCSLKRRMTTLTFDPSKEDTFALVGIMSAQKYVPTRVKTALSTWGRKPPRGFKLIVFLGDGPADLDDLGAVDIVRLPGVDDRSYPPQKKSFTMLKYWYDHFADRYEWFVRADDDVYLRLDKLETFLKSLNSSRKFYVGQPGQGTPDELGKLHLADGDNFCMGGTAVLISRPVLKLVGPHVDRCMADLRTGHEDVELGRCVKTFANVTCSWAYEMQTLFYNDLNASHPYGADLNLLPLHKTITMHPAKSTATMNVLHVFVKRQRLSDLRHRRLQLKRDAQMCADELRAENKTGDVFNGVKRRRQDVPTWQFLSPAVTFCTDATYCPRRNTESYNKYALLGVVKQAMEASNKRARQTGRWLYFKKILYAYKTWHPSYGAQYLLDMLLTYQKLDSNAKNANNSFPVRRHVYLKHNFAEFQAIDDDHYRRDYNFDTDHLPAPKFDSSTPINFVLSVSRDKVDSFRRFLANFRRVCTETGENVRLNVVVTYNTKNDTLYETLISLLSDFGRNGHVTFVELRQRKNTFNRGRTLNAGATKFESGDLLFFLDVDMIFDQQLFGKIRRNVILGRQVYFPIVYSQYDPKFWTRKYEKFHPKIGYFRHFGFGMVGIYKADFDSVGGFDTDLYGWGLEDVKFVEKLIKSTNLEIFRAPETSLVHVYHEMVCEKNKMNAKQFKMCLDSKIAGLAHVTSLYDRFVELHANSTGG